MQNASAESVMKKVKESLKQTARDVEVFLKLFPDFTVEDLDKVNFITLSVLPATTQSTEICNECKKHIVFRNDLNPNCNPHDSLVELLYNDMTLPNKQDGNECLKEKLQIDSSMMTPSDQSLNLMKMISSRLVGMGSLYIPKTYGPSRSYQGAVQKNLQDVNEFVAKDFQKAMFLNPEEIQAMNTFNFAATGFYGVGKTTVLEVAIDKIIEKFKLPRILFVTWDKCKDLKNLFEIKFENIQDAHTNLKEDNCFKAYTLDEICAKYQVAHNFNDRYGDKRPRNKVDTINELCKKLQGNIYSYGLHAFFYICASLLLLAPESRNLLEFFYCCYKLNKFTK